MGNSWLALLLEPAGECPRTRNTGMGRRHRGSIRSSARPPGERTNGGAPLHPPATATTVRVRDGEVLLTDGPYVEGAEVANGFYFLDAADRDEAVKIASMIPSTTVEVRQLMGISGL